MDIKNIKTVGFTMIVLLLILSLIVNGCQQRRHVKDAEEIAVINTINENLKNNNKIYQDSLKVEIKKREIISQASINIIHQRDSLRKENNILRKQLNDIPEWIKDLPVDSSYSYLQKIAYPYSGELKYPFNEPQVKGIHSNYLQKIKQDSIISGLDKELKLCDDRVANEILNSNSFKNSLVLCEQQKANSSEIIKNLEIKNTDIQKNLNKQERRTKLWRTTSEIEALAIIIFLLL